ncbi:hypothetical protein [Agrobacterium fabrum]|uniref:hypothetical protein n=1 Tax=Agrobacterium fabrum TaxID=1176649 RepID=UPI00273D5616|nr:hypothetical protein [Agrobacterium fabrum]WLP54698.1 hypothetical protein Q8X45_04020 [Agrobacterium fabrum]
MKAIRMVSVFYVTAFAISSAMMAPVLAAEKFATKAEFITATAGKTLTTKTKKGDTFTATYAANGKGKFSIEGKTSGDLSWTFKDDTLCSEFKSMKFKECNKVVIGNATELKFLDAKTGSINNTYSVK